MEPDPRTAVGTHRLRRLNQPAPIAVHTNELGAPQSVVWRGRLEKVNHIIEVWRIDDEWWRPLGIDRLYFQLVLSEGRILTVFRDLIEGSWWQQKY